MITLNDPRSAIDLFVAHADELEGDAYSDGCEAFYHGHCTEAEQEQLDANYELAEGRAYMLEMFSSTPHWDKWLVTCVKVEHDGSTDLDIPF